MYIDLLPLPKRSCFYLCLFVSWLVCWQDYRTTTEIGRLMGLVPEWIPLTLVCIRIKGWITFVIIARPGIYLYDKHQVYLSCAV